MPPRETPTDPIDRSAVQTAARLTLAPTYADPTTGALYVHEDLKKQRDDWEIENHIGPVRVTEVFGDVESWAEYTKKYAGDAPYAPLLTWSEAGLRATLDYHVSADDAGRCQWKATFPFITSEAWNRWSMLADGRPKSQGEVVEFLDDNAPDIVQPESAAVLEILSKLRANVNKASETELRPDGTFKVNFSEDRTVVGSADLPPAIRILIPLLKGHMTQDAEGKRSAVLYALEVKLRASPGPDAKVRFRLSIPRALQSFEALYEDRVAEATRLLGEGARLLRSGKAGPLGD